MDSEDQKKKNKTIIQIPSYQQVIESSSSQQQSSSSLFKPSESFSQAFSFLKSSEFYTPPPAPAATASQSFDTVAPRPSGQSEVPPSSSSATATTSTASGSLLSSSSQSVQNRNAILVSHRQKGNPLLKHIRNVRWSFADILCDYMLGQSSCALYLSLRYHLLHPDYLYYRIRELQKNFKLRVVLCHVDVEDVVKPLLEVTRTCLLHDCTLLCAWSLEECGRYLETIKVYENKPADLIQGQMNTDYLSRISHALTSIRHVNKTDVVTLGSTFGSLSHIMDASMEDLARCPGIGERKVKRLYDTFHEPFKRVISMRPAIPETSVQKNAEPCLENEVQDGKREEENMGKRKQNEAESESAARQFRPNSFVLKVNKDGETGLHIANIQKRTPSIQVPFLVDLNGRFLWVTCERNYVSSTYRAPECHSTQCSRANANSCFTCSSRPVRPGCHNNTCGLTAVNPVTRTTAYSELAQDVLSIPSTTNQGSHLGPVASIPNFLFGCAPALLTNGLPRIVLGVLGLGHAPIALPYQLSSSFGTQPIFATCLPTMGSNGVIFFGNGPYTMVPGLDISKNLRYTPLTISPRGEYYIQLTSIRVNGTLVPLNQSLLTYKRGSNGGTMISTTVPYTVLEHSMYQSLVQVFGKQLLSSKNIKQVDSIAPFGFCFDNTNVRRTKFGYDVPNIDLVLQNINTVWTILGYNSMVQPRPGVSCLAFVDGGMNLKRASVVIGAYQLEDNLLQFDLAKSRLGFGSVPSMGTTCGNFSFSSNP